MSTYIYDYARVGKGEMIAKYSGGYIYNLRGKRSENSGVIIANVKGNYVHKYNGATTMCTNYYVEGNIAYMKFTSYKKPILTVKNNVIYTCTDYKLGHEIAEYDGNASEALLACCALLCFKLIEPKYISTSVSSQSTSNSRNDYSSSSGENSGEGAGCFGTFTAIIGFIILFLIIAGLRMIELHYEYYTFLHVAIPAIILIGFLLWGKSHGVKYKLSVDSVILGVIYGIVISVILAVTWGSIEMLILKAFGQGRHLIISIDAAYLICATIIIVIAVLMESVDE